MPAVVSCPSLLSFTLSSPSWVGTLPPLLPPPSLLPPPVRRTYKLKCPPKNKTTFLPLSFPTPFPPSLPPSLSLPQASTSFRAVSTPVTTPSAPVSPPLPPPPPPPPPPQQQQQRKQPLRPLAAPLHPTLPLPHGCRERERRKEQHPVVLFIAHQIWRVWGNFMTRTLRQ